MAFLCNEEKFFCLIYLPSTEQISPGFYIPQTIHRKIRKSYAPFGSNVKKESKTKVDLIPLNHSKNIYLFNFNNNNNNTIDSKLGKQNLKRNINLNILKKLKTQDDIPGEEVKKNYLVINNYEQINKISKNKSKKNPKILIDADLSNKTKITKKDNNKFNCMIVSNEFKDIMNKKYNKTKAIKELDNFENKKENNLSDRNKFAKTTTENWYSKVRTKYNNELLLEFERDKNLNKNAFISSIPYKAHSYGYILEDNGTKTAKENPDSLKIFSGLGKDTVGPGNYDIDLKWNKTMSLWSKSKTKRFSSKKKNNENIQKEFENDMKQKDKYSKTYSSNDWFNKTKDKFNFNKYSPKYISLIGTKESLITPSGELITKSFDKPGRTDKFFINKLNALYPGPGYYYEDDKWSCLKIVRYPGKKKKRFNFGSNVERFELINEDESLEDNKFENPREAYRKKLKEMKAKTPLPTTYFKEDIKRINYLREKFKCPQKAFCFKHIW